MPAWRFWLSSRFPGSSWSPPGSQRASQTRPWTWKGRGSRPRSATLVPSVPHTEQDAEMASTTGAKPVCSLEHTVGGNPHAYPGALYISASGAACWACSWETFYTKTFLHRKNPWKNLATLEDWHQKPLASNSFYTGNPLERQKALHNSIDTKTDFLSDYGRERDHADKLRKTGSWATFRPDTFYRKDILQQNPFRPGAFHTTIQRAFAKRQQVPTNTEPHE